MTRIIPWAIAALAIAGGAFLWSELGSAQERIGALDQANKQLTTALEAKEKALQSRAKTEAEVRKLAPDDVLERLK